MDHTLLAILILIAVALVFDFINGFHDAANSIATVVSTRVLSPGKAVLWAAFFNFVAAFGFGTAVAQTVGAGMVDLSVVTFTVIFAGLTGAIIWDLITWYWGLPTSSSHALFGGYAGAAVAKAGFSAVIVLVTVALFFDYINGFHDAANSIATVVSTRVLTPGKAVIWAAFFNFIAAFVFGTGVAQTIGKGTVDITIVTLPVIFAGLKFRKIHCVTTEMISARLIPITGERTMNTSVFVHPAAISEDQPAFAMAAPAYPPTSA